MIKRTVQEELRLKTEGCPVLIKSDDPRLQCYKNK